MTRTRTWAATRQRAADRAARQDVLGSLTARADRLTPAEAALLQELVGQLVLDRNEFRRRTAALTRHADTLQQRLAAAEDAIREVERDRDAAREELAAVRAYDRALSEAYSWPAPPNWPERPTMFDVSGAFCETCRAWVPSRLSLPHTCPPLVIAEEHTLTDEQMAELTEHMKNRPLPPNVQIFGTT
ncbi:hypothetical protein [Streptomyces filamentosus]|uniref:hypothetical protein n=1 Tax=Streptomyces filamentosus TaxID=67294 RepID=UPI0037D66E39